MDVPKHADGPACVGFPVESPNQSFPEPVPRHSIQLSLHSKDSLRNPAHPASLHSQTNNSSSPLSLDSDANNAAG